MQQKTINPWKWQCQLGFAQAIGSLKTLISIKGLSKTYGYHPQEIEIERRHNLIENAENLMPMS